MKHPEFKLTTGPADPCYRGKDGGKYTTPQDLFDANARYWNSSFPKKGDRLSRLIEITKNFPLINQPTGERTPDALINDTGQKARTVF